MVGVGIAPPFLTLALVGGEWSASLPGRFNPGKSVLVLTGYEAGWAPEPVWTLWREKNLAPDGVRTPTVQSVSRLSYPDT
jgi:hypothetical protein